MVKSRPFYLPREFSAVFLLAVYIRPQADHDVISTQETETLDHRGSAVHATCSHLCVYLR